MEPVYAGVIGACLAGFAVMDWDVRVTGAEHVPATGGGIVATNHVGYLDFIFAGAGVRERGGRRLRFLAKKPVFDHPVAGPLMRAMRHIPVDRTGDAAASLDTAAAALRRGELVGMFPEGTISPSFVPMAGRTGTARLALRTGAPIVPGAVWGSQRILTKGRPRNLRRSVTITVDFGPPITPRSGEDARAVTDRLMAAIGRLVDTAQRHDPDRPDDPRGCWWQPAHLGGAAPTPEQVRRRRPTGTARS